MSRSVDAVISFGRIDYLKTILRTKVPLVCRFGNPVEQWMLDYLLGRRQSHIEFIGVSHSQMQGLLPIEKIQVVHNVISPEKFEFSSSPAPQPYITFLGRVTPNKGAHLAIEAAKKAEMRLIIAGVVPTLEPGVAEYFEQKIKPFLGSDIEYIGPVNDAEKQKLLGGAKAMLFPIQWNEPCANVIPEALACGCPVIAWNMASVPEVIEHGKTGFIVNSVDEMVAAIGRINEIDRTECRRAAEERFSSDHLVNHYIEVIQKSIRE
jgi:glycosyltransferase involved in cell wall biosynthesis